MKVAEYVRNGVELRYSKRYRREEMIENVRWTESLKGVTFDNFGVLKVRRMEEECELNY